MLKTFRVFIPYFSLHHEWSLVMVTKKKLENEAVNMENEEKISALEEEINDIYGELMDLDDDVDTFFPSGSLVLDSVLSNGSGIPMGTFISLNADSGCGKSTLCLHVARNCCAKGQRCLYIDSETGLNKNQLSSFSLLPFVEDKTFLLKRVHTYRELDDLFASILKDDNLKFIFLDSLSDVVPDELLETNIADIKQPGIDARYQSSFLRKYKPKFHAAGKTVFFILQNRTKIGMSWGQQTTVQASGGLAVKYHMDITLEMKKKDDLEKPVQGSDKPIIYGSECLLKSTKNRLAPPFIPMMIQVHVGKGVSNAGALARALVVGGYTKTPTNRTYIVEYEGEEKRFSGKGAYEAWIKDHIPYYKDIVENKLGGIKLLKEPKEEEE